MDNTKPEVILEVDDYEIRNKDFLFSEMICNTYCVLFHNFSYVILKDLVCEFLFSG